MITSLKIFLPGTASAPGQPSIGMAQIGADWVTINWDPPLSDGNAPIRNYTIQYQLNEDTFEGITDRIAPNITSYTINE